MRKYLAYQPDGPTGDGFWEMEISRTSLIIQQGKRGTAGSTTIEQFDTEDACQSAARRRIQQQQSKHYIFVGGSRLPTHKLRVGLAEDITRFAELDAIIRYGPGDIPQITVVIDHQRGDGGHHSLQQENIYEKELGLFCTTAYVLAARRGGAEQLVWLPELSSYGMWHETHRQLFLFAGQTWENIRHDIPRYFNEYGSYPDILTHLKIWEWFDFIPASLPAEAAQILSLADDNRPAEAEAFIRLYEERLLQHPFCPALEDAFRALVSLYNYMGQLFEEKADYGRAIVWLEKAVQIIHQSATFRSGVFIHTFLQLSFCHLESSSFEAARLYIDTYQLYDPSAAEECGQIRNSIQTISKVYGEAMDVYQQTLLGGTRHEYEQAIAVTMQALHYAPNDPILHFNLACFYAVLREVKKSLYYLDLAFSKGFQREARIFNDRDLENIRTTQEFTDMFIQYFGPQKG